MVEKEKCRFRTNKNKNCNIQIQLCHIQTHIKTDLSVKYSKYAPKFRESSIQCFKVSNKV